MKEFLKLKCFLDNMDIKMIDIISFYKHRYKDLYPDERGLYILGYRLNNVNIKQICTILDYSRTHISNLEKRVVKQLMSKEYLDYYLKNKES